MTEKWKKFHYYAAGMIWFAEKSFDEGEELVFLVTKFSDYTYITGYDSYEPDYTEPLLKYDNLIQQALVFLDNQDAIKRIKDNFGPEIIEFTNFDILSELANKYPNSPFHRTNYFGEDWIEKALIKINSQDEKALESEDNDELKTSIADDDIWEPLQIDHSLPEYEETIAGIEKAIREIGADNGFSATYPDERNNFIDHANATIKSIKEGKATKKQVKENLVNFGKWVATKFTGASIGVLGKNLMEWALKLIGLGG